MTANDPIQTTVHLTEKFRCNLCGNIFEHLPDDIKNKEKFDEKVLAHIVMHKCFYGVAFGRDAASGGLSASVISELFKDADDLLFPIFEIVAKTLISDDVIAFDDTKIKIQPEEKGGSKSAWASCFVSRHGVVYILDRRHAGKCFEDLLKKRPKYLKPPVALSDALPAYEGYKKDTIDAHCLTHARRRFKVAEEEGPEFCQAVVDLVGEIYDIDIEAKKVDDIERMKLHQEVSAPIFEQLIEEMEGSLETKRFLPNSDLGRAAKYIIEHQDKLRVFMNVPGVPLDTNHVERKIKCPIRIRKQAPIFKTEKGALRTGRLLSLVETAIHIGVHPGRYIEWAILGSKNKKTAIELTPWAFKRDLEKEQWSLTGNFEREDSKVQRPESQTPMATNSISP